MKQDFEIFKNIENYAQKEAWNSYTAALTAGIKNSLLPNSKKDFKEILETIYLKIPQEYQPIQLATETCSFFIKTHKLSFQEISQYIGQTTKNKFKEAYYLTLESIWPYFSNTWDQTECLEAIAHFYIQNPDTQNKAQTLYKKILNVDPKNLQALIALKHHFILKKSWQKACTFLVEIIRNSSSNIEKIESALELSSIFFYELSEPQKALETLNTFLNEQSDEANSIRYDCYYQLSQYPKCLEILNNYELNHSLTEKERSKLLVSKAKLLFSLEKENEALNCFKQAFELNNNCLESLEQITYIFLSQNNISNALITLKEITRHIPKELSEQLEAKIKRLENLNGLNKTSKTDSN
jgi:thioredoxin-like negative regulator of GroEL